MHTLLSDIVPYGADISPYAGYLRLKSYSSRSDSEASPKQPVKEWMPEAAVSTDNKVGLPIFASTVGNGLACRNQGRHVGAGPQCSLDELSLETRISEYFDTTWGGLKANLITISWHHGLLNDFGHDENTTSNQANSLDTKLR